MRISFLCLVTVVLLAGCGVAQLYTPEDLHEVRQAYAEIRPLYIDFRDAFHRGDSAVMMRDFALEKQECKLVDKIDNRDSIDPNTNLFQVSAGLDGWCNDIESVVAAWQKLHHQPYDKTIIPAFLAEAFHDSDKGLKDMAKAMRHPSDLS